jgi:class 3 adenylate cyclase
MAFGEARPGALCYSRTKVLRTAVEGQDGFLSSHTGDGVVAAFASPRSAVDAAVAAQRALEPLPKNAPKRLATHGERVIDG